MTNPPRASARGFSSPTAFPRWGRWRGEAVTEEVLPKRYASRLCHDKGAKPTEGDLISLLRRQLPPKGMASHTQRGSLLAPLHQRHGHHHPVHRRLHSKSTGTVLLDSFCQEVNGDGSSRLLLPMEGINENRPRVFFPVNFPASSRPFASAPSCVRTSCCPRAQTRRRAGGPGA